MFVWLHPEQVEVLDPAMKQANNEENQEMASNPYWTAVLTPNPRRNPRADILEAAPGAEDRVGRLCRDLTVEEFVGLANALFNSCDPKDLREEAPGDVGRQAQLAWKYLNEAKQAPNLGGKWATSVRALRPGAADGLSAVQQMTVDEFVGVGMGVISKVYRKV